MPTGPQGLDVDGLKQLLEQPGGPRCATKFAKTAAVATPCTSQHGYTWACCPCRTTHGHGQHVHACNLHQPLMLCCPACRPKLCYTIPIHNNPTGATIPVEERMKLLQLAHQFNFVLVCDEVYQLLSFPESPAPPPPMRAVERSMFEQGLLPCSGSGSTGSEPPAQQPATPAPAGAIEPVSTPYPSKVVSLGSFSKIMAPGLRLGWVDAAEPLLQRLRQDGVLGSGGSIAPLASGIAHSCLELGLLQQHMHGTVRPTLQRNCAALCDALRQHLPEGCSFRRPQGGYFVWLQLPDEVCHSQQRLWAAAGHMLHHARACGTAVRCTCNWLSVCVQTAACL